MKQIYTATEVLPNVFRITEAYSPDSPAVNMYLVRGSQQSLLLDTGFGVADTLRSFVEELTDKPIICVVAHGHPDHAGAAGLFDTVYMNHRDEGLLPVALSYERRMGDVFGDAQVSDPELKAYCEAHIVPAESFHYVDLEDGAVISLGDVIFDVLAIPGHTNGSLALVEREKRYALVSDAFSFRTALVSLPPEKRVGITAYRDGLQRFLGAITPETKLFWGHQDGFVEHCIPEDMLKACNEVLDGHTEQDRPSVSRFAKRNSASSKKMMEHPCGSVTLVYDANTL